MEAPLVCTIHRPTSYFVCLGAPQSQMSTSANVPRDKGQGGKNIGLQGGDGTEAHPPPPPAGTISRPTKGDCGGSLYFLILLGGVWMAQHHIFLGCANGGGDVV